MSRIDHEIFQGPGLEDGMELFAFESDFVATLRCIPMAVRFKLDLACVKVSLRQWSRFTLADRFDLLTWPCATADEIGVYRQRLVEMIKQRAGEAAKLIDLDPAPAWAAALAPPQVLQDHAALLQADSHHTGPVGGPHAPSPVHAAEADAGWPRQRQFRPGLARVRFGPGGIDSDLRGVSAGCGGPCRNAPIVVGQEGI